MGASSWPLRGVVTGKQVEEKVIGRESSMHCVVRKQLLTRSGCRWDNDVALDLKI
jgi:hypothetical protein